MVKEQEFVVGINCPTELEDDPDVLLGPELCSEIDIGLGYEDFTVYEPVTEPSLVAGECQTDEELTSFYGYLDDSVASTMVDFSSSTETDMWFPIETCAEEWLNIRPATGCPLVVDLGILPFPGIEYYGIGDDLGQVIITTGPSDEVYHQSRHIEGGSSSDEDFRIDKARYFIFLNALFVLQQHRLSFFVPFILCARIGTHAVKGITSLSYTCICERQSLLCFICRFITNNGGGGASYERLRNGLSC